MRWFRLTATRVLAPGGPERGDVPGWVLITGMTVALVMLVWGVASDALRNLITGFLSNISFGG
jgi:hypothetical protein